MKIFLFFVWDGFTTFLFPYNFSAPYANYVWDINGGTLMPYTKNPRTSNFCMGYMA